MTGETLAIYSLAVCLAMACIAMARIAWTDIAIFEIDFTDCAVLALAGLGAGAITAGVPPNAVEAIVAIVDGLVAGVLCAGVAGILHWRRPARMGRGDVVLLGVMGAVAGTRLVPHLMIVFLVFTTATAAAYSIARGKPLFRSAFPAALPGMAALAPILAWRHAPAFTEHWTLSPAMTTATLALIMAGIALAAVCIPAVVRR